MTDSTAGEPTAAQVRACGAGGGSNRWTTTGVLSTPGTFNKGYSYVAYGSDSVSPYSYTPAGRECTTLTGGLIPFFFS